MSDRKAMTAKQVKVMAEAVNLRLSPEALDKLADDYSSFLAGFAEIRRLQTDDREPAVLVLTSEVER